MSLTIALDKYDRHFSTTSQPYIIFSTPYHDKKKRRHWKFETTTWLRQQSNWNNPGLKQHVILLVGLIGCNGF